MTGERAVGALLGLEVHPFLMGDFSAPNEASDAYRLQGDYSGGFNREDYRKQMARKLRQALSQQNAKRDAFLDSPLCNSPSFLIRLAQLGAFDEFHRHFAGLGVTPARFSVFALIVTNPGVRPNALSEELRVKPSNIAALVNALVADDLVERQRDKSELRTNQLRPTKAGLKAFTEMWDIHCHLDKLLLERLNASERKVFVKLMQKIDRV